MVMAVKRCVCLSSHTEFCNVSKHRRSDTHSPAKLLKKKSHPVTSTEVEVFSFWPHHVFD